MKMLKEILSIVTSLSDSSPILPDLGSDQASDSLAGRFIRGIADNVYTSDDDAAMDLYGAPASDQRFRTLKSRTYDRLMQSLLFLQLRRPEHSEYLANYYKCMRMLLGAQILIRLASRRAGFAVATKALTIAERYEFTDLCLPLVVILRDTGALWDNHPVFFSNSTKVRRYSRQLMSEYEADSLLNEALMELRQTHYPSSYFIEKHRAIVDNISAMHDQTPSHALKLNMFRSSILFYETRNEYESVHGTCLESMAYLDTNPHLSQRARIGEFKLRMLAAEVYTRQSPRSSDEQAVDFSMFRVAGANWYLANNLIVAQRLQALDFEGSHDIYCLVTQNANYSSLETQAKECWAVFAAYLLLAEELHLWHPQTSYAPSFRLSTFLNSVSFESQSKKGSNIPIVIFHAMFLLLTHQQDAAEKRIDYLSVYSSRYLKDVEQTRVRLFIKALQYVPRHRGDVEGLKKVFKPIAAQIREAKAIPMPGEINELIPYDVILEAYIRKLEAEVERKQICSRYTNV